MSASDTAVAPAEADLVTIEIDGVELKVPKGSMIIEAADKAGIDIPRFCYHPGLSIAANCRMCLVDVEKAPKPLPACSTPVGDGMKVFTTSRRAIDAQHGVMEFLLINHPLDCPICDQGGECELQDLAMGYGRSVSRFTERKRVVKDKNVGSLVQTDMTRCIHCTRCIRFLEEIAGTCEMGGLGRGDRLEIGTGIERGLVSELSGNIIDLCPVGALTNKPFRYSARAWELTARPTIALHDGVGSALWYHVTRGAVKRAVPRENVGVSDYWISDRDRYSHFGLGAADRVTVPQVKRDGEWAEVSWDEAMAAAAAALRAAVAEGGDGLGVLMSSSAADEEYFLAQRLARGLGSPNIDHRLREIDFADDGARPDPAFERQMGDLEQADAVLLVGSNVRLEAPIIGHKVRQAWRHGARVDAINPVDFDFHFDLAERRIVPPQRLVAELAAVARAAGGNPSSAIAGLVEAADPDAGHQAVAEALREADDGVIILGQLALGHPAASALRQLAAHLGKTCGVAVNRLSSGANAVGATRSGAVPYAGPGGSATEPGRDARAMLAEPRTGYLLWGIEPDYDSANPALFTHALAEAEQVVAVASYATASLRQWADVILPLAPWPEAEGTATNFDGDRQSWQQAQKIRGEQRPGWKILRRLGAELELEGYDQVDLHAVRDELDAALAADAPEPDTSAVTVSTVDDSTSMWRVGAVPPYSVDPLVRRSEPLQRARHGAPQGVYLNPADAERLGLSDGGTARVRQGEAYAELTVVVDEDIPAGAAAVAGGTCESRELGDLVGPVSVEVA